MEKVGAIAGDVLHVIQKLLPSSINKDDTGKISLCSIQILEKTLDLKAQVETYYKSIKFSPSQFTIVGGLCFLDSLIRKLNEMSKSKSSLDFLMKPLLGNLEEELSALTSILEKDLSSLSSIFRDVTKVHHEHEILHDLQRRTINLAYEVEVAIDSILAQYNIFWLTTQLEKVGEQVKYHTDPYSLPFLTTEESCKLLQKKVFQREDCLPKLQDVSQAVAEKCKGLPLVVV
ncbi:hypothetical protein H5410_004412 [Solanum commersonii]|uniref:Uncharacterized protein n=1 Tax=Solanum commersonii TaxID=4109 RepID=A0A9J6B8D1_SOLCO|nr:hypothetical protein H5410_004412 [Solanum commersonii]